MTTLFIVLACFAGLCAFGFGLAGILGLSNFQPPEKDRRIVTPLIDQLVTGGIASILHDVAQNWPERATERRLVYVGVANGVACITLLLLARAMA